MGKLKARETLDNMAHFFCSRKECLDEAELLFFRQLVGCGRLLSRRIGARGGERLEVILDQNVVQVDAGELWVFFDKCVQNAGEYVNQVARQTSAHILTKTANPPSLIE